MTLTEFCALIQEGPKTLPELVEASGLDAESVETVMDHLVGLGLVETIVLWPVADRSAVN
jgi:DNA-binding IclR family transcriptional regulator